MESDIDFKKLRDSEEDGRQVAHWQILVWFRSKEDNLKYYEQNYCCKTKAYEWIKKLQESEGLNMITSDKQFMWIPKHRIVEVECNWIRPEPDA